MKDLEFQKLLIKNFNQFANDLPYKSLNWNGEGRRYCKDFYKSQVALIEEYENNKPALTTIINN